MSLNRQFLSSAAMMLNVAEQINPSKEVGFTQPSMVAWVHHVASDRSGELKLLHNVPRALVNLGRKKGKRSKQCWLGGGFLKSSVLGITDLKQPLALQIPPPPVPEETMREYVEEIKEIVSTLRNHIAASTETIRVNVRLQGKTEPVTGNMQPNQILDGMLSLVSIAVCQRTFAAYRDFFLRQHAEYDEVVMKAISEGLDGDVMGASNADSEEDTDEHLLDDADPRRRRDDTSADPATRQHGGRQAPQEARQIKVGEDLANQAGAPAFPPSSESYAQWNKYVQGADRGDVWKYPDESPRLYVSQEDFVDEPSGLDVVDDTWFVFTPVCSDGTLSSKGVCGNADVGNESAPDVGNQTVHATGEEHPDEESLSTESDSAFAHCCTAASASAQIRCANQTAPPSQAGHHVDPKRVLIVTYATPHVHGFARFSLPILATWAKRFGHSFVIDTRDRATDGVDVKNSKVLVKKHWVAHPAVGEEWLLWIGADAVIVDFNPSGTDVLRDIISKHGQDPNVQVIITRDPHGRAGNSMSLFNADVILLRRSAWTAEFMQKWWDDPRMKQGRTDQEVLELLYTEDVFGAYTKFVLLPPLSLNSDSLSIVAGPPSKQPVVHLGGHADTIRTVIFKDLLDKLCVSSSRIDRDSNDIQEQYLSALWAETASPGAGVSSGHAHSSALTGSFQRLAWHLEQRGQSSEAIHVQRAALKVTKKRFGARHRDTLQATTALGNSLRHAGKVQEAERLHRAALQDLTRSLGADHRDTLTSANNLALVLEGQQRFQEAEQLYRRSRQGLSKVLGADAPATLSATFNLASVLAQDSRSASHRDEAELLHRAALNGRQRVFGPTHPTTWEALDSLAQLLVLRNKPLEAEPLLRSSIEARAAAGVDMDRGAVQSMSALAQSLKMQHRVQESVRYFQMAYDSCRDNPSLGGPEGPNTLAAASNLATALQEAGRIKEAGKLHRLATVGLQRALGAEHPNTRSARLNYDHFLKETQGT